MTPKEFETIVGEAFLLVPEKFRAKVKNVALLVEDGPSDEVRKEEELSDGETLLGLYKGIPRTERGDWYGVGPTMPDTITLYRLPIPEEAKESGREVREVVKDTIWHEIAHYFGMDEPHVGEREGEGTNKY